MENTPSLSTVLVIPILYIYIDIKTKEVVDRWLIRLESKPPNIVLHYNVTAPLGEASQSEFEYKNTSVQPKACEFSTSHPDIFNILEKNCTLKPGEKTVIPVLIKPMDKPTELQILVFAYDTVSNKHEAISFSISYLQS